MAAEDEEAKLKVPELRQRFLEQFAESIDKGLYASQDVERVRTVDAYLQCFLLHQHSNVERAANMMDMSLKFRNDLDVNNLTEASFPRWMHEMGAIYYHNRDKDGHKILYFQVSKNKKDPENLSNVKKFVAWWIDKYFLKHIGERIVVLFDMTNAGLANMDMELIKFQISCFTTYYPALLEYMMIYDMPWVMNAIWKIIKNILTAEQQKHVIFAKRHEIQQYIPVDQLWCHMGGTDDFQYSYLPSEDSGIDIPNGESLTESSSYSSLSGSPSRTSSTSSVRKRVTFAEKDKTLYTSVDSDPLLEDPAPSLSNDKSRSNSPPKKLSLKSKPREGNVFVGPFAAISPADNFTFAVAADGKETSDILTVANVSNSMVAYKVKTTSPDAYRVRPSTGLVKPNHVAEVTIHLQAGCESQGARDRFLVMVMKVEDDVKAAHQLAAQWKAAARDPATFFEHRIGCQMTVPSPMEEKLEKMDTLGDNLAGITKQMEALVSEQRAMKQRMSQVFVLQVVLTLGLLAVILFAFAADFMRDTTVHAAYASSCTM